MMGKTHRIGGLLASAIFLSSVPLDPVTAMGVITCGVAGSLLPDIDHRRSTAAKSLGMVGGITSAVFRHRGILHSPLFYTIIFLVLCPMCPAPLLLLLTSGYLGVLSHLLLDMLNPVGIPLVAPLSRKRTHIACISTGGFREHMVKWGMLALCGLCFFVYFMKLLG